MTRHGHLDAAIDPGLQTERTYLAWQRTGLAYAGVGALLIYGSLSNGAAFAAAGGLAMLCGAVLIGQGRWRYRTTMDAVRNANSTVERRLMAAVGGTATMLCLAGLGALFA